MKLISMKTPSGTVGISLLSVAEHRALYYSTVDEFDKDSEAWKEEISYIMDDNYEGIDWFENNMDEDDVKRISVIMLDSNDFCASDEGPFDQESLQIIDHEIYGDSLVVEMSVHQKFNPSVGVYVNKSYQIKRVITHAARAEQKNLFS